MWFRTIRNCCCLSAIVLFASTPSLSASNWHFGGHLGVAAWLPDWDHELTGFDASTHGIGGPSIFLRTGPVGLGIQYYTGSFDVTFPDATRSYRTDRTDLDLMLSWRFLSYFHVSALYKNIDFDWHQAFHVKTSIDGFGLGAGATRMVLDDRLLMYGYGFYMPALDYNQSISSSGNVHSDASGYWVELGTGWLFKSLHLMCKAGYRRQVISVDGSVMDWSETTQGPRLEFSYIF